jgi:transcriptional regulator with XRE-family HTH domain
MKPEDFKLYRMKKGLSQKRLAEILGIDRSYMNQIERGRKIPSLTLLKRIAKVLGKNIKDFF